MVNTGLAGAFLSPGTLGIDDAVFIIRLFMELLLVCTLLVVGSKLKP